MARYLDAHAPIAWVRARYDDERGTDDDVWHGLADLGVTGLLVPERLGGAGRGMGDAAVVLEALGAAVHPGPYASSAVGAASLVTLAGDESAHVALLPGIADGSTVATTAVLEPGRRAAWRAPTTVARLDGAGGGDGWRLRGTKVHVGDLVGADLVVVTATDPAGALGVFTLSPGATGASVAAEATVDGSRKRATLELHDAPARRVDVGDATEAIAATVDRLGVAAVVDGVGAASRALELSLDHARSREQFGRPIGSFQAVQHLCADMLRSVELARASAYYACWACDEASASERHRAVTMALAFATDELFGVGASAVQVHGGIGYAWEHDVHLFYKRLLSLQEVGGGATAQLEELATIALDGSES